MTNKELQETIARLETELAEVKEMAEAMKKKADGGVFKPKYKEDYWYIDNNGGIYSDWWENYQTDKDIYSIGNCFPTEQSAEDTVRVLKLIQKARESQDGFVPDWEDMEQSKYRLAFEENVIKVGRNTSLNPAPTFGYWEVKSVCDKFIIDNHDELIWFFTEYRR